MKMIHICMRIKDHFHFRGFALKLSLKQRPRPGHLGDSDLVFGGPSDQVEEGWK